MSTVNISSAGFLRASVPQLATVLLGAMSSMVPTLVTGRRLQETLQPMIVEGFKFDNNSCVRLTEPSRRSQSYPFEKTGCGIIQRTSGLSFNGTESLQIFLPLG